MRMKIVFVTLVLCIISTGTKAHEMWLEPKAYQVAEGETIAAQLLNGQMFEGAEYSYNPNEFVRFEQLSTRTKTKDPVKGRLGDLPALSIDAPEPGLHIVTYQSVVTPLRYETWDKFKAFADQKAFNDIEARHDARKLPRDKFNEAYARYIKTLVAVGDGKGMDTPTGLETEIVALANPYTDALGGELPVRVLYRQKPRASVQVTLFEKAPNGSVSSSLHLTDNNGVVRLPVKPGHGYLVDSVVLREPSKELVEKTKAVWETLWAALTFKVPS